MESLLSPLISSDLRARLLLRFFANPGLSTYLRALAKDFTVSPNAVREELSRLSQARLLTPDKRGRQVHYQANRGHPLFEELVSMAQKSLGINKIVESILARLGRLELAMVVGDYAVGQDSGLIDLVLVGQVDQAILADMVARTEAHLGRKIRTLVLTPAEFQGLGPVLYKNDYLVLWENGSRVNGRSPAGDADR